MLIGNYEDMLIDLVQLKAIYNLNIEGILHVGAHHAEELPLYQKLEIPKVIWVEGDPSTYKVLASKIAKVANQKAYNLLVSDVEGQEVMFNIASFSQSSSILEFGSHKKSYPEITTKGHIKLKTVRLDKFFQNEMKGINFVNLDIQGAELMALRGMGKLLDHVDYIYLEVNLIHVYKGGARLHQIDLFLGKRGFLRVEMKMTKAHWGDAFYVKLPHPQSQIWTSIGRALFAELQAEIKVLRDRFYKFRHNLP